MVLKKISKSFFDTSIYSYQAAIAISLRVLLLRPPVSHVSPEKNNTDDDDNDQENDGDDDSDSDANWHLVLVGAHKNRVHFRVGRSVERRAKIAPTASGPCSNLKSVFGSFDQSGDLDHLLLGDDDVTGVRLLATDVVLDLIQIDIQKRVGWREPW